METLAARTEGWIVGLQLAAASLNTLKSHMKNVYAKLGVNRRFQAIEQLRKLGLD